MTGAARVTGAAGSVLPGLVMDSSAALFDVTKGNNDWFQGTGGAICGYDYLCVARTGYDGPTGLGTPDGTGAF